MMLTENLSSPSIKDHEWQYNPRVSSANVEYYRQRATELSKAYREQCPDLVADIPYGNGEDETLDLFPAGKNAPAHLFLHGGYWRGRDKRDYSFLAAPMKARGITLLVANYSLCPKVTLADIVAQASRCLAALPSLAERYGFDGDRLTASGHSAGAHLLAASLFSDSVRSARSGIKAATLISGIYDLEPVLGISLNETIGLQARDVEGLSPMRLSTRADIALDIVVGGQESPGWIAQSALFTEKCQKAGAHANLLIEPEENHFSIMEKYGSLQYPLCKRLCDMAAST
jgi:arylformamidase